MKKKIVVALVLIILSMGLFVSSVNAGAGSNINFELAKYRIAIKSGDKELEASSDEILQKIQEDFGYDGEDIKAMMKFEINISIKKTGDDSYRIKFGTTSNTANRQIFAAKNLTKRQLMRKYSIDESDIPEDSTEIPAIIVVKCNAEEKQDGYIATNPATYWYCTLTLDQMFTGDSIQSGRDLDVSGTEIIAYDAARRKYNRNNRRLDRWSR